VRLWERELARRERERERELAGTLWELAGTLWERERELASGSLLERVYGHL